MFTAALKLAEWIGPGREVTTRGVLKPADAVEACDLLGITPHSRKPRSALDIPKLMAAWTVAAVADFIEDVGPRVRVGPGLRVWREGPADEVLAVWGRCARELLAPLDEIEEDDLARLAALTALHENGVVTVHDLHAVIAEFFDDAGLHFTSAEALRLADDSDVDRPRAWDVALLLADFGIVALRGDEVGLTPLGRWFTTLVFREGAPPPDVDATTLIDEVEGLPPRLKLLLCHPWLDARTPAEAARELLATAARISGPARNTALALLERCGPEAEPAWREWATRDGIGAYARSWLSERSGTALTEDDKAWLIVDTLINALEDLPPDLPEESVAEGVRAWIGTVPEALPHLAASTHPDAPRVMALLTTPHPSTPESGGVGYDLEVRLRYVTKPPVWRRLEVPAHLDLGDLHWAIQAVMGWENSHMHAFDHHTGRYGTPDPDLDHHDERRVTVSQLLTKVGDKLVYEYDFGDGWEHDITLKAIVPAGPIRCTSGKGACPPEDCGGPWGYEDLKATLADPTADRHADLLRWMGLKSGNDFDPKNFSVESANQALTRHTRTTRR